MAKGASSAKFCFAAIYGEQYGNKCTIGVEGKRARKHYISRFITPLTRITDGFAKWGGLPASAQLKPEDSENDTTWLSSMLQVQ